MTTTTDRPVPWPSRRERDGAVRTGRHAAVEPDLTRRLPIVVPQQRTAGAVVPRPAPASRWTAPPPPRPAVGSGVGTGHRVDGRVRHPRNGLGVAAACLAAIGLPFGLVPVTGFLAAGLGVLALVFGIAGLRRARARTATNGGVAVTGAVIGLVALALGVVGTVAFVRAPDRLVYDLDALTAPTAAVSTIGE